jgi:hypothetical protein
LHNVVLSVLERRELKLVALWHKLQAKKPELVEAVLDGNYDSDITINPKVNLFSIYDKPPSILISCVRSICESPLRESPVLLLPSEKSLHHQIYYPLSWILRRGRVKIAG